MRLAITILGNKSAGLIAEISALLSLCQCEILEIRSAGLTRLTGLYLLIDGNWNQIAKLQALFEVLAKRYQLDISFLRPEETTSLQAGVPCLLETISSEKKDVVATVSRFLLERAVSIEELSASRYPAPFFEHWIFSTKFIVLVPNNVSMLSLREDFLDFCDEQNIDGILEPIKR